MCKPGSVGDLGGQPPRSTRPSAITAVAEGDESPPRSGSALAQSLVTIVAAGVPVTPISPVAVSCSRFNAAVPAQSERDRVVAWVVPRGSDRDSHGLSRTLFRGRSDDLDDVVMASVLRHGGIERGAEIELEDESALSAFADEAALLAHKRRRRHRGRCRGRCRVGRRWGGRYLTGFRAFASQVDGRDLVVVGRAVGQAGVGERGGRDAGPVRRAAFAAAASWNDRCCR